MSIECLYKDINWCLARFYKSDDCYCDGNLIVPDSLGDIAKILSVKTTPSISDSKTESGRIVVSGQVKINVLYIADDENGKISSLTASVPFSHIINAPDVTDEFISLVSVNGHSSNHTVINSRRLKVTTTFNLCASSYKNSRSKVLCDASGAQTKTRDCSFSSAHTICQKNIPVSQSAELPAGKGAITRILRQDAKISDYDYKALSNKAIIKGNILISVLYLCEDNITQASVTVPFTEVVEAEGLSPSYDTVITPTVADCEINEDTDLSGDYKMLDISLILNVSILSFTRDSVNAVTDIYLPGSALKGDTSTIFAKDISKTCTEEEFVKETLTLPNNSYIASVIDTNCTLSDFSVSDNTLSYVIDATVTYIADDETSSVNTHSVRFPASHKFSADNPINAGAVIKHLSYAIASNDSVELRLAVVFSATVCDGSDFDVYTNCEETAYTPQPRSSIVVSFINKGDTLWDIAKKYNITVAHLASANALDENAILTVGEKLIIPR